MAAVASVGETSLAAPATRGPQGMQRSQRRRLNAFRYVVFTLFGLFIVLPLLALARFSLEGSKLGTWSVAAWKQIVSYPGLASAVELTLELAVITSLATLVLLLPTMIWIKLRVQWISRTFEFLCLLPLTIPAIALVVGLGPVYNRIQHYSLSALQLFWVYVILALPYAYRALSSGLDALDAVTLAEAARSLGASWFTVMFRVIAPNMRQAILNCGAADRRAGAGRVHHRLPAAVQHAAADPVLDQPEHAQRRGHLLDLPGLAAVRLRPADNRVLCRTPAAPGMRNNP